MRVQIKSACSVVLYVACAACAKGEIESARSGPIERGPSAAADVEGNLQATSSASRFFSGAEWVLDPMNNVISSTSILLDREFDSHHGQLRVHTRREQEQANGAFAAESAADFSVVAARVAPWGVEGLAARADGTRSTFSEEERAGVLVSKEIVRDDDGRILLIRVTNATPLREDEFDSRAKALRAKR